MTDEADTHLSEKDPRHKTAEGFIAGMVILAAKMADGPKTSYFMGGEHDVVHIYVGTEQLPEDSDDGKTLVRLGFHVEDDGWAFFT